MGVKIENCCSIYVQIKSQTNNLNWFLIKLSDGLFFLKISEFKWFAPNKKPSITTLFYFLETKEREFSSIYFYFFALRSESGNEMRWSMTCDKLHYKEVTELSQHTWDGFINHRYEMYCGNSIAYQKLWYSSSSCVHPTSQKFPFRLIYGCLWNSIAYSFRCMKNDEICPRVKHKHMKLFFSTDCHTQQQQHKLRRFEILFSVLLLCCLLQTCGIKWEQNYSPCERWDCVKRVF